MGLRAEIDIDILISAASRFTESQPPANRPSPKKASPDSSSRTKKLKSTQSLPKPSDKEFVQASAILLQELCQLIGLVFSLRQEAHECSQITAPILFCRRSLTICNATTQHCCIHFYMLSRLHLHPLNWIVFGHYLLFEPLCRLFVRRNKLLLALVQKLESKFARTSHQRRWASYLNSPFPVQEMLISPICHAESHRLGEDSDEKLKILSGMRWCVARHSGRLRQSVNAGYKVVERFYKPTELVTHTTELCVFGVLPVLDGRPSRHVTIEAFGWDIAPPIKFLAQQLKWLHEDAVKTP